MTGYRGGSGFRPTRDAGPAKPAEPQGPHWRLRNWFTDLSEEVLNKLRQFHLELLNSNKSLTLIPSRSIIDSDAEHITDSIIGGRIVLATTQAKEIFDLGSGNGLPGIVLAILDPTRKIVLVERDERKIEYLKNTINKLQLKNMAVYSGKFEELHPGSVHAAVTRDYANLSKTILMARKPCAVGADFFHFKGESWVTEVADIPSQICVYWQPKLVKEYSLPIPRDPLAIVVTKKLG